MAIGRIHAVAIIIVQQNILLGQGVMIRRYKLRINAQARIAISLRDVAKDLVVSLVLLQNVEDMLENRRLADAQRHWYRRLAVLRHLLRLAYLPDAPILMDLRGIFAERFGCWNRN